MFDRTGDAAGGRRARADTTVARLDHAELAWILLLPAVVIAGLMIWLLAPLGGRLLLPDPGYHFWLERGVRKPAVQVGYVLFVLSVVAYVGAIMASPRAPMRPRTRRAAIVGTQGVAVVFLGICWFAQGRIESYGASVRYFTPATLAFAAAATTAVALALRYRDQPPRGRARVGRGRGPLWRSDARDVRWACLGLAVVITFIWVLPAVHTDEATPSGVSYLGALFFDESMAVLNGRSPLVDMVAYANVWPYLVAVPLWTFNGGYGAYSVTMALLTGFAMLAIYGVLRRVVGRPVVALALYVPVLATGFFLEDRTGADLYDPGTYFGMFPLRYAGPYLLAWMTAWQLQQPPTRRWSRRLLFTVAGLVAVNNLDFGCAALAATAIALVIGQPRDRRALTSIALDLAAGVGAALALVVTLTLVRTGSLPHLELLTRYGRIFVNGGYGNLPLPALGVHLAISATFVAAGATAAVRAARADGDDLLAGMLAWCATFGLGASVYYYAYRSHPEVLINLFSIWSLTLALLLVAVARAQPRAPRWPTVPALAVMFGFALAVCSIAQVPWPWEQLRRISEPTLAEQVGAVPAGGFRQAPITRIVAARTRPGEPVVILSPLGHRVAWDAGVVNVSPYPGFEQMVAREQLVETIALLRRDGGTKVYVAEHWPPELKAELRRLGFGSVRTWSVDAWPETTLAEYRAD